MVALIIISVLSLTLTIVMVRLETKLQQDVPYYMLLTVGVLIVVHLCSVHMGFSMATENTVTKLATGEAKIITNYTISDGDTTDVWYELKTLKDE